MIGTSCGIWYDDRIESSFVYQAVFLYIEWDFLLWLLFFSPHLVLILINLVVLEVLKSCFVKEKIQSHLKIGRKKGENKWFQKTPWILPATTSLTYLSVKLTINLTPCCMYAHYFLLFFHCIKMNQKKSVKYRLHTSMTLIIEYQFWVYKNRIFFA